MLSPAGRASAELAALARQHQAALVAALLDGSRDPPPGRSFAVLPYTTQVPNHFIDDLAPELTEAELRVLLYLCRRTLGFGRLGDRISLKQFTEGLAGPDGTPRDRGTGLSRRAIINGLEGLQRRDVVVCVKMARGTNGCATNFYHLNLEHWQAARRHAFEANPLESAPG